MTFTIEEMRDIYWTIMNYAEIIKKVGKEGSNRLIDLKEKIWEQLTIEQKKQIHPEREWQERWH